MQSDKAERLVLLNAAMALAAFKTVPKAGTEPDGKEKARRSALGGLQELLQIRGAYNRVPEDPLNLLFAALDHCEAEGKSHRELVDAFNEHAESRASRLRAAS